MHPLENKGLCCNTLSLEASVDRGVAAAARHGHLLGMRAQAKNILIATGGAAILPPIEGAREHAITSDEVINLKDFPQK